MSGFRLEIDGLDALIRALRQLPAELADEARSIIDTHATTAESAIQANYEAHSVTGKLAASVGQKAVSGLTQYGHGVLIYATAKQAYWFEHGTAARHTDTGSYRGVMPPAPPMHQFVPVMERVRRAMYQDFVRLLEAHGLEVTGDAG